MKRRAILVVRITVALFGIGYILLSAPLPLISSWWVAGESNYFDYLKRRHRIADGLVLSGSLMGKSRHEVEQVLGPPIETDYFRSWHLVYLLGAERSFISIDSEWLVIQLNELGIVSDARVLAD